MKNKKVRIITIILIVCIFVNIIYCNILAGQIKTLTEENTIAITQLHETQVELNNIRMNLAEANETIRVQSEEIERYKEEAANEDAKWQRRYEEYPEATEAWIAMKSLGWNDTVCAGIMGNLMAETGGTGTLYLDWDSNGNGGYGLVQWIGERRTDIKTKYGEYPTIKEQIQFVYDELYGTNEVRLQVTDSQRDKIINAETPEECAYAFACYYERCASEYRNMRKSFARKAYEYFTS